MGRGMYVYLLYNSSFASVGYPKENFWIEPILAEFGNM